MAKEKQNFEQRLERLRAVVDELERADAPLERSLALYKEGLALSGDLARALEAAKNEVKLAQDGALKEFAALSAVAATAGGEEGE
jgi:exodeoxyribonuclease VII small subunit